MLVSGRVRFFNGFPYNSISGDVTLRIQSKIHEFLDLGLDTVVKTNKQPSPNGGEKW